MKILKMCFDNYGNIVMVGSGTKESADILTLAYNRAGDFLWKIFFNGDYDGQDKGTGITSDSYGNIFVTGEVQKTDTTWQQVTIKYKTDYFLVPQDTVPAPSSLLFYPNSGQIIDTHDSIRYDVAFYTINQFPKLYFHQDSISFVMAHVDSDIATTDTLEKITMNFAEGNMANCDPYTSNTHDTDQVLNYFLGHCPDGITGITGSEKIMYSNVYENTDVIFSNNNAGMKFQIIMNPGAEPQAVLHFTGHQSLQLVNNADLQVSGVLGSFIYERPLVYQLDNEGNRISLGWLASYYIVDSSNVAFQLSGSYDNSLPLVVQCAREVRATTYFGFRNLRWNMFYGGTENDIHFDITTDDAQNMYGTGQTQSVNFPVTPGVFQTQLSGLAYSDAFVVKFKNMDEQSWATYYGGSINETGNAITVDNSTGEVYITGWTSSGSAATYPFPTNSTYTTGGTWGGGTYDGFIVKFNSDGTRAWANLIPGNYDDLGFDLTLDKDQNIYVAGYTSSSNILLLNTSQGYYQDTFVQNEDGFIIKFDAAGTPLWNTYFGGVGADFIYGITATASELIINGNTSTDYYTADPLCTKPTDGGFPRCHPGSSHFQPSYEGNTDDFIASFDILTNDLTWSTFLGGTNTENANTVGYNRKVNTIITPDESWLYLTGFTASTGAAAFSVSGGGSSYNQSYGGSYQDGYIAKFDNTSKALVWSTYFGGDGAEYLSSVTADEKNIYIIGTTNSATPTINTTDYCDVPPTGEFPLCDHYTSNFEMYQPWHINASLCVSSPYANVFLAAFDQTTNEIRWSSYFGQVCYIGNAASMSYARSSHQLYIAGTTSNFDHLSFPTIAPDDGNPWIQLTNPDISGCKLTPFYGRFDIDELHIGTDDLAPFEYDLNVFPNPTQDFLYLDLNLRNISDVQLKIYDIVGRELSTLKLKNKYGKTKEVIDISKLTAGVYFVNVSIAYQSAVTRKIIKE